MFFFVHRKYSYRKLHTKKFKSTSNYLLRYLLSSPSTLHLFSPLLPLPPLPHYCHVPFPLSFPVLFFVFCFLFFVFCFLFFVFCFFVFLFFCFFVFLFFCFFVFCFLLFAFVLCVYIFLLIWLKLILNLRFRS